jgi:hypothetical protein
MKNLPACCFFVRAEKSRARGGVLATLEKLGENQAVLLSQALSATPNTSHARSWMN